MPGKKNGYGNVGMEVMNNSGNVWNQTVEGGKVGVEI